MVFDSILLDNLSAQAKVNPRLRQLYDLRESEDSELQQILNALEPGTIFKIHKHPISTSNLIVLRGAIRHYTYDDNGNVLEQIDLYVKDGFQQLIVIEPNVWHSLECLETGTVIYENKNGKYDPNTDSVFFEDK